MHIEPRRRKIWIEDEKEEEDKDRDEDWNFKKMKTMKRIIVIENEH